MGCFLWVGASPARRAASSLATRMRSSAASDAAAAAPSRLLSPEASAAEASRLAVTALTCAEWSSDAPCSCSAVDSASRCAWLDSEALRTPQTAHSSRAAPRRSMTKLHS